MLKQNQSNNSNEYCDENIEIIFDNLKSIKNFLNKDAEFRRTIALLESLFSILNVNKKNEKYRKNFLQELFLIDQMLSNVKLILNNADKLDKEDIFELQHLLAKNFHCLLKINIVHDSPLFSEIFEHLIDNLIHAKTIICKLNEEKNEHAFIIKLNSTCLLFLRCVYFITSKCSINYNNLRKSAIVGKFVGILRCFFFYGLNKYDLNLFSVNLYPSPLSQFMSKDITDSNIKKRKNKLDDDDLFNESNSNSFNISNLSNSEYSSSELDESFSSFNIDSATTREIQNKKIYVKIRMFSYECLQASLSSTFFDIRTLFGFWSFLFPDSGTPNDTQFSILTTISNDTSNSVRISALNFMYNFFDDGKQYVQILVQETGSHKSLTSTSFTPLSTSLTAMIKELHNFFSYILLKETKSSNLILVYKVLLLFVSITPYNKLNCDILHPLFYQNSFLMDNKVTQIKNLSLAFYVKIFSLSAIPKELELWMLENKLGTEILNKILKNCYEFIDNQEYILLIIESIKLFISILKHHQLALNLFQMEKINFQIDKICQISLNIIELDKAFNNSVLQNLMCKFIHTIGSFLKDIDTNQIVKEQNKSNLNIFADNNERILFIKNWYLKVFDSKIFRQALVEQDMNSVQRSSQVTMINCIALIPQMAFALFGEMIRFNIISILISLCKIDENLIKDKELVNEEGDLIIYTKATSIRCLSIIQTYDCCCEDVDLIYNLIDICMNVLGQPSYFLKMPRKKQIFILEHTLWAMANMCDSIKKKNLQLKIDKFLLQKIAVVLNDLFTSISIFTDDILINLVRNSGIVIYMILYKQNARGDDNELNYVEIVDEVQENQILVPKQNDKFDQKIFLTIIEHLVDILRTKKSYKLQWNICIAFSYLFQLEAFVDLCNSPSLSSSNNYLLNRIFTILYQTFKTTVNHKVLSSSIFTISSIVNLEHFSEHLKSIWLSIVEKFTENFSIVPTYSKKSWFEKFSYSIERFYKEFVCKNLQDDDIRISREKLIEFLHKETQSQQSDCNIEEIQRLYEIIKGEN